MQSIETLTTRTTDATHILGDKLKLPELHNICSCPVHPVWCYLWIHVISLAPRENYLPQWNSHMRGRRTPAYVSYVGDFSLAGAVGIGWRNLQRSLCFEEVFPQQRHWQVLLLPFFAAGIVNRVNCDIACSWMDSASESDTPCGVTTNRKQCARNRNHNMRENHPQTPTTCYNCENAGRSNTWHDNACTISAKPLKCYAPWLSRATKEQVRSGSRESRPGSKQKRWRRIRTWERAEAGK